MNAVLRKTAGGGSVFLAILAAAGPACGESRMDKLAAQLFAEAEMFAVPLAIGEEGGRETSPGVIKGAVKEEAPPPPLTGRELAVRRRELEREAAAAYREARAAYRSGRWRFAVDRLDDLMGVLHRPEFPFSGRRKWFRRMRSLHEAIRKALSLSDERLSSRHENGGGVPEHSKVRSDDRSNSPSVTVRSRGGKSRAEIIEEALQALSAQRRSEGAASKAR